MNNEILARMAGSLERIESKLDEHATRFDRHVADDALVAHDVRMLARHQRGFISGVFATATAIGAGAVYAIERLLGRH
jgi:hypothetical protein